ncbi:MAG: hypothetical protein QOD59_4223 [Mycobacterium sp.]|nr:hypothetical protein [Mycobacterium sp.]
MSRNPKTLVKVSIALSSDNDVIERFLRYVMNTELS